MPLAAAGAAALSFIAPSGEKAERGESRSRSPRSFWSWQPSRSRSRSSWLPCGAMLVGVADRCHVGQRAWSCCCVWRGARLQRPPWHRAWKASSSISERSTPSSWPPSWAHRVLSIVGVRTLDGALVTFSRRSSRIRNSAVHPRVRGVPTPYLGRARVRRLQAFMAGQEQDGWQACVFPQIAATGNSIVLYLVLAFAVLACAFVLFSEKEFDRLFKPRREGSLARSATCWATSCPVCAPTTRSHEQEGALRAGHRCASRSGGTVATREGCAALPWHGLRCRRRSQAP